MTDLGESIGTLYKTMSELQSSALLDRIGLKLGMINNYTKLGDIYGDIAKEKTMARFKEMAIPRGFGMGLGLGSGQLVL